jgi:hypothetical protein
MQHSVYASIVNSVKCKKLVEPFTVQDFKRACPGFGAGTYNAFLYRGCINKTQRLLTFKPSFLSSAFTSCGGTSLASLLAST